MSYLIDTNVISETIKPAPDAQVQGWFQNASNSSLYISVLTLGEIRKGIEKLDKSHKKQHLISWLENDMVHWFGANILPITLEIADKWGYISYGTPLAAIDSLLAATALVHNLKIVTRNVKDFDIQGLEVINPWGS